MSKPPVIHIIGGGIAGLTLGQSLRQKGLSAVIYDRHSSPPAYGYGITLQAWTWQSLHGLLQTDESSFRRRVAVDNARLGTLSRDRDALRAHRGRLEGLLREGLDVRLGGGLEDITAGERGLRLLFEGGQSVLTKAVVAADGVHSQLRKSLARDSKLRILPFVVFNGRRRIGQNEFTSQYATHFEGGNIIQTQTDDILLQLSINDHTDQKFDISYTYSRAARTHNDLLHKPDRPLSAATATPEAFYLELETLQDLDPPFASIFDASKVRQDRVLHWLMRSSLLNNSTLLQLAKQGIAMIGDATHATPILGGDGANVAVRDAILLAERIESSGFEDLAGFYEDRREAWTMSVEESEQRLVDMHSLASSLS
jgi:2-polyprenyl-6-methoxyphenol hydroxylase-like FAD-dependent oxidoreductase